MRYIAAVLACLLPAVSLAQSFQDGYPFALPARDTSTQRLVPAFPAVPIGSNDFVTTSPDRATDRLRRVRALHRPAGPGHDRVLPGRLLMASVPSKGKPFTISEYNHPFPNRYQTEDMLFLAAHACFHGADGIMIFDY